MKRYDEALIHFCAARDYFCADGDDYYSAIVILNIARLYLEQKLPQKALSELESTSDLFPKLPAQQQAMLLTSQAEACRQLGDREQEKTLVNQALAVYQKQGSDDTPQIRALRQRLAELDGKSP